METVRTYRHEKITDLHHTLTCTEIIFITDRNTRVRVDIEKDIEIDPRIPHRPRAKTFSYKYSANIPAHWGHDLIASAVHLGEELFGEIVGLESFSEQELRSVEPKYYPSWIPQYQTRRPDGYWRVTQNGASQVIALEVETTRKRKSDYETIARQYDTDGVDIILWVVSRPSLAKAIHSRIEYIDRKPFKHNFVLLDAFYEKGWTAPVFLGEQSGKSIRELLGNFPGTASNLVPGEFLLDTRKKADISKPPQIYQHPQVC